MPEQLSKDKCLAIMKPPCRQKSRNVTDNKSAIKNIRIGGKC